MRAKPIVMHNRFPTLAMFCYFFFIGMLSACTNTGDVNEKISVSPERKPAVTRPNRVTGEYIVTITNDTDIKSLDQLFINHTILWKKPTGRRSYLIKIKNDPGPKVIERIGMQSTLIKHIQPNFLYYTNSGRDGAGPTPRH